MKKPEDLKQVVKQKYSEVATTDSSCCSSDCGCIDDIKFIGDEYQQIDGYFPEADLGLGCGLPTELAQIKEGDVVVDLGSGAGNDCFVARSQTGQHGKIIGIDFTPEMIEKARQNAAKLGFKNVHFIEADIEKIPLSDNTADVIVSNCVLNLVPDKQAAFSETLRILKPGGHFSISDVVLKGALPDKIKESAEMYAGCVSGAIPIDEYLDILQRVGFENVAVQRENRINIPEKVLQEFLTSVQIESFDKGESGIYSISIYGEKPEECCESDCCE
jgi:ubiquinone/menaquinone biosynthesis C-methylase UbiE